VCAVSPTFASIECRLAVLAAEVDASGNLGRLEPGLLRTLARALKRTDRAESQVTAGHRRSARRALGAAIRNLVGFRSRLSSPAARRIVPPATRTELMGAADLLLADLRALRQGI
jgi:hypothetical protein